MSISNISNEDAQVISDIFRTMQDPTAALSPNSLAKHWLETCGCFTGFVNGKWMQLAKEFEVTTYFPRGHTITRASASSDEILQAIENSREGFHIWQKFGASEKAKVLYKISECIERNSKLLNAIESLSKNGLLREKYNVQYLINSFHFYAGILGDKELSGGWKSNGVVCIISDDDNLVSSLWLVSALLASGNAVIFLIDDEENLSAFLLAQLCHSAGLPAGVFNVVFRDVTDPSNLSNVDKIIFSSPNPQEVFLYGTLNKSVPWEIISQPWPCIIIYESADLDAAISSILEILQIFDVQGPWPMCNIYLQESVQKKFINLLALKVLGSIGCNADIKPPFYFMGQKVTTAQISDLLTACTTDERTKNNFSISKGIVDGDKNDAIPCTIMNFQPNHEVAPWRCGPGVYVELFRTFKESIAMFNQDKKKCSVSIWSEDMNVCLEAASKLKSRTVWINSQNIYEPSITTGSLYLSGNSNIGGKEGIFSHISCSEKHEEKCIATDELPSYGSQSPISIMIPLKNNEGKKIEKCVKLYIGGSFVDSSGETFQKVLDANNKSYAFVASASKSDVDKAVSVASSSQPKWESLLKTKRAAVLRKTSEMLNVRKEEFSLELHTLTGRTQELCSKEVEAAASVLTYWANYIAHFGGRIVETKFQGKVFQEYHPLGVIAVQCPDREPLLSFVFLITPAICFGNSVVAISSEKYPTCALKMCEVFHHAGLPAGVLNVVSSSRPYLTRHLTSHLNIDAMWFSEDGDSFIYDSYHSVQPKKIFNCKNMTNTLDKVKESKFLFESTYSKAVFIPVCTSVA